MAPGTVHTGQAGALPVSLPLEPEDPGPLSVACSLHCTMQLSQQERMQFVICSDIDGLEGLILGEISQRKPNTV